MKDPAKAILLLLVAPLVIVLAITFSHHLH